MACRVQPSAARRAAGAVSQLAEALGMRTVVRTPASASPGVSETWPTPGARVAGGESSADCEEITTKAVERHRRPRALLPGQSSALTALARITHRTAIRESTAMSVPTTSFYV